MVHYHEQSPVKFSHTGNMNVWTRFEGNVCNICQHLTKHHKCQPHGGASGNFWGFPESSCESWWKSIRNFIWINKNVAIFQLQWSGGPAEQLWRRIYFILFVYVFRFGSHTLVSTEEQKFRRWRAKNELNPDQRPHSIRTHAPSVSQHPVSLWLLALCRTENQ